MPGFAFYPDFPALHFDELFTDRQSQPSAGIPCYLRRADLYKTVEDRFMSSFLITMPVSAKENTKISSFSLW
jgi:hypothetical protein